MTAKTGLRWTLRERTAEAHRSLDDFVSGMGAIHTREGLVPFLLGHAAAHRAMLGFDDAFVGHMSRRLELLKADLAELGLTELDDRIACEAPSFEAAPGYRYVVAGSAMGGRMMARHHAKNATGDVLRAARFLGDDALVDFWKDVQSELDHLPKSGPAADAVVQGASSCFALFETAFRLAEAATEPAS